jgi:hypothetical protein
MHQDAPVPLLVPVAGAPRVAPGPTGPRRHHAVDPHIIKTVETESLPVEIVGARNVTLLPLGQPLRARLAPSVGRTCNRHVFPSLRLALTYFDLSVLGPVSGAAVPRHVAPPPARPLGQLAVGRVHHLDLAVGSIRRR